MAVSTLLGLSLNGGVFSLPEFAARGITMTMEPIAASANIRRDINMNAVNLAISAARKYRFTISCSDHESPGLAESTTDQDAIWPGDEFTLTCIPHLGSSDTQTFTVMLMTPWKLSRAEWEAQTDWSMEFEQV